MEEPVLDDGVAGGLLLVGKGYLGEVVFALVGIVGQRVSRCLNLICQGDAVGGGYAVGHFRCFRILLTVSLFRVFCLF